MKYEDFEKIIYKLQAQNTLSNAIYDIIRPEAFDSLYEVINILLKEVYTEIGNEIFFEYIYGENKESVFIDSTEYRCKTIEDLYNIMEKFKL